MFQITSNTRRKRSNAIHEVKNAWKNNKELFRLKFSLVKLLYFECFRSLQTHAIRDRMQSNTLKSQVPDKVMTLKVALHMSLMK